MGLRGKNNVVNNNDAAEGNSTSRNNNTVVNPLLLRSSNGRRGLKDTNKNEDDGGGYDKKGVNSEKDVTKEVTSLEEEEEEESSVDTKEGEDYGYSKHGSKDVDGVLDPVDDTANQDQKSDEDNEKEEPIATILLRETDEDDEILVDEELISNKDVDIDGEVINEEDGAEKEVSDKDEIGINLLNSDEDVVSEEEEEVEKSEEDDEDIEGGTQSGSADIGNMENVDNDANGESGEYVAAEGTKGEGGDKAQDEEDVEELSSVASVLNDEEEGENVDSGDEKNSVSFKPNDVPVEVQEEEEEEEPTETLLESSAEYDEDSKDEVGEVMATNEDEEAVVIDNTAAEKSTAVGGDDKEVADDEADEKANNLGEDSSSSLESATISNLKDSVSDDEDAVAESIEKDWETKVEIPLDDELAAVDNTAMQQQSKSGYVNNNEKSSDGHEFLPDDGSGDDYAGEDRGKVMKTGEWDEDDDDDKIDVSASEMKSSVGDVADTNQKTEQELSLEMILEKGDLEEKQVDELDEEMEKAIDEGVGAPSELNLRDADKEIVTGGTADEREGVTKTASMAIIGLSRDDNASTVVLVDDPPVIGEVSGVAASSSSVSEEGTNPSNNIQVHTFDNLLCKDDPESYLAAENIRESIKRRIDEGVCDEELFTVDLAVQGASSANFDGNLSVNASEVLRIEEAVHSTDDDDVNNGQRHLTFKAGYYDKNGEVAGSPSQSNGTITATSNKLVVTVGSRHCPETCHVVSECERARDYFNPENKSSSTMGIGQLSEAEFDDTNAETDDNVSLLGSDYPDDIASAASNDYVPSGQEVEHEGQEYVSEGKLTNTSCQDDSNFLYKDKPGFTCEYIAATKPDKCVKPLIVTSCPVSCNMVEECEQLIKGVSAASIDEKEGNLEVSDLKPIEEEESIMFEDETPSELIGNITAVHEVSCKDDKQFLYKDKPGFTCEYIALNKPDKCLKLHNGDKVGAISCPESCNMIQECEDMHDATGVVFGTNSDTNLDTNPIAEEEKSLLIEGESGGFDVRGFELTGEDTEEMSAIDSVNTTEVSGVEQEDITDPKLANDRSDGYESGVNWSADSEDEPLVPTATEPSTLCKDSESFLYKDKPGYTCAVLGEMKPEKCLKLHNGVAIGLTSCPQSCDMVGQCLDAAQEGVVSKSPAVVLNEYSKPHDTSYTAAVQDGDDEEVSFATGRGSTMQGVEDVATFDQNRDDNGADEELKYIHDEEETMRKGDVMASMGTKSMADEINHEEIVKNLAAPDDGLNDGSAYKSSVDNDDYKESTDDMEGGYNNLAGYNNNPYQVTESFEQDFDRKSGETKDEMSRNNDWDNNQVDEDYNEGFPNNSNNWEDNNDAEWGDESISWNAKSLDEEELPWDTPTNNNSFGDALPTNNVVPSGQEIVPSLNTDTDGYAWDLDDDEGGFPAGLFIALIAVFIFFVYRKRQNRNEASRDCTSRGGYQRVQPLEGHSKKW